MSALVRFSICSAISVTARPLSAEGSSRSLLCSFVEGSLAVRSTTQESLGKDAYASSYQRDGEGLTGKDAYPLSYQQPGARLSGFSASAMQGHYEGTLGAIDEQTFLANLMPKKEIGVERFLASYPEYDGRGVTIAIFDSGVDPAAAGLQTTSDGKPKILDILDCTGSGDVDTSTVIKADKDGFIKGASGRELRISLDWKNPSGEWRIGCKLAYELFTETLVTRLKQERRKKWEEKHSEALIAALRQLVAFDQKHPKPSDFLLKKEREDLQHRVDLLQKLSETYEDKGPMIDAVVWNDGDVWRIALDTEEMGSGGSKLADFTPLTNYRLEHKHGIFSSLDACSFVANVYADGNILSIVTDSSPHGTHVAGITAAYHADEPLLCGVAPGAQIVSCKIGDSRLGSMETGTGLVRALIAAVENKCDLINMSYGEPTTAPDYGRFVELTNEVVDKYGIMFVSSAGNAGPSLNTVGAPGGTSSNIIGIGAYVSPDIAIAAHSLVDPPLEGLQYTWSSRGPTSDGDVGVSLSAPGAAVAPVPLWTLQRRMLMNGTSMASPCACGGIALVLSALKNQGQPVSPWVVRKALENTAMSVGNSPDQILTTGAGLLQVDRAYEYLQKCFNRPAVSYQIQLNRGGNSVNSCRGVYLREPDECLQASEWTVQVKPKFHEDADKVEVVVPFEEHVQLESTDPTFVKCPEYVLLTHNGRNFNIVVDPTVLKPGVTCAAIHGIDCEAPWRGPIFRVPITVLKPIELPNQSTSIAMSSLTFKPGEIMRMFIAVPNGATWAEAIIKASGFDTPRRFYLNFVQILPQKRPVVSSFAFVLAAPSIKRVAFHVEGGVTMELTVALFWSSGRGSEHSATADVEVEFHGLVPSKGELILNGGDMVTRIDIRCPLGVEVLAPAATLHTIRIPYRPTESKLQALSDDRDKLPSGRQILLLTLIYQFTLGESCKVTPRFANLNKRLYDNEFESQFYMIADANQRVHAMGDVYPKGVKLPKGDYTLRLHLRHDSFQYLEKYKKAIIFIDRKLDEKSYIRPSFFMCIDGGVTGSYTFKPATLVHGQSQVLYVSSPAEDKLPKDLPIGSLLVGKITYGKIGLGTGKDDKNGQPCSASYPIMCVVPPLSKNDEKAQDKASPGKKSSTDTFMEQVRDAKIKALSSLPRGTEEERKDWSDLAAALKKEYPKHLQLLLEILIKLSSTQKKLDGKGGIQEVIIAADEVIENIDKDVLARYFGVKNQAEEPDAVQLKTEMEKQRDALVDALYKKGVALAELEDESLFNILSKEALGKEPAEGEKESEDAAPPAKPIEEPVEPTTEASESPGGLEDKFEETYTELRKWVDITSTKYGLLHVIHEKRAGRLGTAIKVLNELVHEEGKPPKKSFYELQIKLLEQIGWAHWAEYTRKLMPVLFPHKLPLF